MIWILAFLFIYGAASVWDVTRTNSLYRRILNPSQGKEVPDAPPAPRLVIDLPPKKAPNEEHPTPS